jgi:hypothetical protein
MIRGLHGLFYSSDPDGLRAFLRDKLRLPHTDIGEGWLIFDLPEADLGVHPTESAGGTPSGTHDVSFYCDDIQSTVADLRSRGVEFEMDPADHGYGWVTYFSMPGGVSVQLYEPKYQKPRAKVAGKRATTAPGKKQAKAKVKKKAPPAKKKAAKAKPKAKPKKRR